MQDFALIIYQNEQIEEIGLRSLTHILRGGVRIESNPKLCYVKTIAWQAIVSPKYFNDETMKIKVRKARFVCKHTGLNVNIFLQNNAIENTCPDVCPDQGCTKFPPDGKTKCWSKDHCQIGKNILSKLVYLD